MAIFVATAKADKRKRILLILSIRRAQKIHSQDLGIKMNRSLKFTNTQHRMQNLHEYPCEKK
jgi:hypothetical protein